eukprot:TRINITY_DN18179_c0_g1_i1.p2 TRINITY_DN18179_c0_g1~~TRINITY_DN18179_c0_g1_i1.p2  ORF type:complete len:237 (+),score=-20.91 TRINITY_DN18179_c0_g1_i1:20-730(+)
MVSYDQNGAMEFRYAVPIGGVQMRPFEFVMRPCDIALDSNDIAEGMRCEKSSTLVILPRPEHFEQFVRIKKNHMNPRIKRKPYPHVTLLSPFPDTPYHSDIVRQLTRVLAKTAPFRVDVEEFKVFENGKTNTLYLDPKDSPAGSMDALAALLAKRMPGCAPKKFDAHIGVAFTTNRAEAHRLREKYQGEWRPISFVVTHLYLMHRRSETDDFAPVHAIPLGGSTNLTQPHRLRRSH